MIVPELNQERLRGSERFPKTQLDRIAEEVSKSLKLKSKKLVSVAFVSEKEMKKLNFQYRGANRVTDVLSFTLAEPENFGEIILSYEQASRQAKQMKHSVRKEITFLLVHGFLHVFGFDHEKESDAKKMFPLQSEILKRLGVNPQL